MVWQPNLLTTCTMHARALFKRSGNSNHNNKVPARPRLLATVLLLGAVIVLLARTFSWQNFAFGTRVESSYISGLCSEFLNWAPGSEFLPRAQRLSAGGYPASSFHNVVFGVVSSVDSWPAAKSTAHLWWRPNVTRGFVLIENGDRGVQLQQKQEEEEFLEQRRQVERDQVEHGDGQTSSLLRSASVVKASTSNRTSVADSNLEIEVDSETQTIDKLAERLAEGYGQGPIVQVYNPDVSPPKGSLANAFLRLVAQDLADVHWFVLVREDAIFDVENLAGVLNR